MSKIKVVILAAGFGERFDQSVRNAANLFDEERENFFFSDGTVKPKALLKIGGKEILLRHIEELQGIREIDLEKDVVLVTNHRYYQCFKDWLNEKGLNINIIDNGIAEVKERKGAVVDLYDAAREANIQDEFVLVLSSDILFGQFKIRELVDAFNARGGKVSLFPVYKEGREHAYKRAVVGFDSETKTINKFVEKPKELDSSKEFWASPAIYLYNKEAIQIFLLEYIKASQGRLPRLDSPGLFNEYLVAQTNRGAKMEALEISGKRFDVGDYEGWQSANEYFFEN